VRVGAGEVGLVIRGPAAVGAQPRRTNGHAGCLATRRNGVIEEVRFAIDSPLEGGGFEVLVPLARAFEPFLFPSGSIARNGSFGNEGKPLGGGAAAR
jgi:hypothetical protein